MTHSLTCGRDWCGDLENKRRRSGRSSPKGVPLSLPHWTEEPTTAASNMKLAMVLMLVALPVYCSAGES